MIYTPPNYDKDFGNKIAVVTGASSGIGKSVAEGLAHHGAKVCNLDLNGKDYKTDLSDPAQVKRTVEKIVEEHGSPWILVNNAGIEYNNDGDVITMPKEKTDKILDTNLQGYLNMDKLQEMAAIVTPEDYTLEFREKLHSYVQLGMDRAIELIR